MKFNIVNDIKKGNIILYNKNYYQVNNIEQRTKGRQNGFFHITLKNILNELSINVKLRPSQEIQICFTYNKKVEFLYKNYQGFYFIDKNNLDEIFVNKEKVFENDRKYIIINNIYNILFINDEPIKIYLPDKIISKVIFSPTFIKGNSISSNYKPIILENNIKIQAPLFIEEQDIIIFNINNNEYLERIN